MNKRHELKTRIGNKISNTHYYLESVSAKKICIAEYENDSTSYILKDIDMNSNTCMIEVRKSKFTPIIIHFDANKVFSVCSPDSIIFMPVDGDKGLCKNTSVCDFIIFNKKYFCFVELKLNATSLDERKIEDNRKKAIKQLKNTIHFFDAKLAHNYCGLNLEAYVATPDSYPREDTAFQSIKVRFLEETGIKLYESRVKQ
jgi:hypothetical protein